jgi:predicted metal-dependent hydrolase
VRFDLPDDLSLVWTPAWPELSCAANAISLLMPFVEPYLVRAVRAVRDDIDEPELRRDLDAYVSQELAHHAQHRRFNELVVAQCPSLVRVERWIARVVHWLEGRSARFSLAFAAGGETVAYCSARWVAPRMGWLFMGAAPEPASLFLWHLAEEVEHKRVAFDVFDHVDGSRLRLARGMVAAFIFLASFTIISTFAMLARTRRIWNPIAHARLLLWGVQFAFCALPVMATSVTRSHHPDDLADPDWYGVWLGAYDGSDEDAPSWQPPARGGS